MAWILGARFVVRLIDLLGVPLLLGGLACILVMWLFLCVSYGVLCREEVFYFLRRKGFNVCSRCGYWLRELPDDIAKCPECGTQREPMPPMTAL